ncbi:MAG: AraC family transcriptional regulator [Ferruginibacter sp.]
MEQYSKIYLYRRIVQAKIFIDIHFSENLDLHNISDEAYFSRFHFIWLFKTIYKKTPHQYLTIVRIENAKLLLKNDIPISGVCYAIGFSSVSSFTGLFKRIVGITPSLYQQRQAQLKADIAKTPLKYIPNCFAQNNGLTKNSNFKEVV